MTERSNTIQQLAEGQEPLPDSAEPRWRRRPDDRPGEILDAALAELADRGYAGCSMDRVARRAGVSKGTVYVYFPTKADLVRALVAQAPGELSARLGHTQADTSPLVHLRRIVDTIWSVVSDPRVATVYRVLDSGPKELTDITALYVRELTQRSVQAVAGVIAGGAESGVFRPCHPLETGRMIVALVFQHIVWCKDPALSDSIGLNERSQAMDYIERFYRTVLSPQPG